jgi:hypothetical protein
MSTDTIEALVDDSTLLVFDGSVLELFGYTDVHRTHVWQRPRLVLVEGKRPRLEITTARGLRHGMTYDPARRAGLEALDAALAEAIARRDADG